MYFMNALSVLVQNLWPWLSSLKSRSKVNVKVPGSKLLKGLATRLAYM